MPHAEVLGYPMDASMRLRVEHPLQEPDQPSVQRTETVTYWMPIAAPEAVEETGVVQPQTPSG